MQKCTKKNVIITIILKFREVNNCLCSLSCKTIYSHVYNLFIYKILFCEKIILHIRTLCILYINCLLFHRIYYEPLFMSKLYIYSIVECHYITFRANFCLHCILFNRLLCTILAALWWIWTYIRHNYIIISVG